MGPEKSGRLDKSYNSFDCISLTLDTSTLIAEQHFKINKDMYWSQMWSTHL